ncbi:MAG: aminopeptidase N [Desulfoarculaceae bacterium]|nr:aminopeptidase N [Desulfoarculaceae bacterium]
MTQQTPPTLYRQDYSAPDYLTDKISMTFQLNQDDTLVTARSHFRRNSEQTAGKRSLFLNGQELELVAITLDSNPLTVLEYSLTDSGIMIHAVPDTFVLEITTRIFPDSNTELEGLYRSSGNYCTQCEAEGFRKITYYQDRPDVMARFTTRIEADVRSCPILLSNGNLLEKGSLQADRHYAVWQDPFPKPCYLFALVAGALVCLEDNFVTNSGRAVLLQIYVEARNQGKCGHAMHSLKKAMRWDEEVFGLEYDLDRYMIVAVDDFNMGAMENKGLNVFNSKYVLASPETATDQDYLGIEGVIAHEYFHNWTGNRVTCRDWFQLSLKEGLTVFRDQQFSADMNSRSVQRIDDVRALRTFQFKEDSGPMAHPVRPDSYVEINNFYTVTVYNKGAEVIRMMHTLLGANSFRQGMDLYFARHDGQAVTCDDFVAAMSDASGVDLEQFKRWYSQAGTPVLRVSESWDGNKGMYTVTVEQSCPPTPGQEVKQPFLVPMNIGLLDSPGKDMVTPESLLQLRQEKQSFSFSDLAEKPVLSFLRGFSAPVKVELFQGREELAFLMAHDSDLFNRWDAANRLSESIILECVNTLQQGGVPVLDTLFVEALRLNLRQRDGDKALLAQALTLPAETTLALQMKVIDPDNLYLARRFVRSELARQLSQDLHQVYDACRETSGRSSSVPGASDTGPSMACGYALTPEAMGRRSLKNICLSYLLAMDPLPADCLDLAVKQYEQKDNMTDVMAALSALANCPVQERQEALNDFYRQWQGDPLVVDKWLTLQATSSLENTLETVKYLLTHPAFSLNNPNKVRSLIGAFGMGNHVRFHASSGAGYAFLAEQIIGLDPINPQIASRLMTPFTGWKRYDTNRQQLMRQQLERIGGRPGLSAGVYELVEKSLL